MKLTTLLEEWENEDQVLEQFKKLHQGSIKIEFMGEGDNIKLVVQFEKIGWLFNNDSRQITKYFDSIGAFIAHVKKSIYNIYQSDMKKVYENIFNPQELEGIFKQIAFYAKQYPEKAKSLSFRKVDAVDGEKNTNWDMEIIFKRSLEKMLNNQGWKIHPMLTGGKNMGKIIAPNEQEVKWSPNKLKKFIADFQ